MPTAAFGSSAASHWTGGDAQAIATTLLGSDATTAPSTLKASHLSWWHFFRGQVGLIKLSSSDGSADYMENLRVLDLYGAAAQSRDTYSGSKAGVADLFSPYQDSHRWDPGAWWHWNTRMQVQTNLSAGAFDLNTPYFRLHRDNLSSIQAPHGQPCGHLRPGDDALQTAPATRTEATTSR